MIIQTHLSKNVDVIGPFPYVILHSHGFLTGTATATILSGCALGHDELIDEIANGWGMTRGAVRGNGGNSRWEDGVFLETFFGN